MAATIGTFMLHVPREACCQRRTGLGLLTLRLAGPSIFKRDRWAMSQIMIPSGAPAVLVNHCRSSHTLSYYRRLVVRLATAVPLF